jgi:nicotinamide riboside kinase
MCSDLLLVSEHTWELKQYLPKISWRSQTVRDYLLLTQLFREARANAEAPGMDIICDTGVVEAIAHSRVFGVKTRKNLVTEMGHRPYDLVLVCDPTDVSIQDNTVREVDPFLRNELHHAVLEVAADLSYKPVLLTGSIEDRETQALQLITSMQSSESGPAEQ